MSQLETTTNTERETAPPKDDGFCHIDDGSAIHYYCGGSNPTPGQFTCPPYKGEAICPGCGRPTCPQCAVMADLANRIEE